MQTGGPCPDFAGLRGWIGAGGGGGMGGGGGRKGEGGGGTGGGDQAHPKNPLSTRDTHPVVSILQSLRQSFADEIRAGHGVLALQHSFREGAQPLDAPTPVGAAALQQHGPHRVGLLQPTRGHSNMGSGEARMPCFAQHPPPATARIPLAAHPCHHITKEPPPDPTYPPTAATATAAAPTNISFQHLQLSSLPLVDRHNRGWRTSS
jgi:hypothetical protein